MILCLSCDDLARYEIHVFAGHWILVHHDDYMQGTNKAHFSWVYENNVKSTYYITFHFHFSHVFDTYPEYNEI